MKECISLLARTFWLDGEIVTRFCCLFIGFDDGSWLKALYNDEEYIWEIGDSEVPDLMDVGDADCYFPYKQYLPEGVASCGQLVCCNFSGNNVLTLTFSSKLRVVLSFDPATDYESIEINT